MKRLQLTQIAAACGGEAYGEATVSSVCTDTRAIEPGCLYLALRGERYDGNDFCKEAVNQGASAVLCERRVDCGAPFVLAEDTRAALLRLAGWYRRQFDLPVAAVTGSVGKTTTKEMTHAVLSKRYRTLRNEGNRNNEIGMPMTILRLDDTYRAAVLEMGMNHAGEIARLARTASPNLGIITNIGVSHIENLGSQKNILKAKLELLDGLEEYAPLLLNGDDALLAGAKIEGHPVFYYGIENEACRIRAVDIEEDARETRFTIAFGAARQPVVLPTVGRHNVYNALAAYGAGVIFGVSPVWAAQALGEYIPSGMRQRIRREHDCTVIEDCYNANPDSMRAAVDALRAVRARRRVAVLGDMLELGDYAAQAHRDVGRYAAENGVDLLLACGPLSAETVRGAREQGMPDARCLLFLDKQTLAQELLRLAKPGDAILVKASRTMRFEDVLNALYEGWNIK